MPAPRKIRPFDLVLYLLLAALAVTLATAPLATLR